MMTRPIRPLFELILAVATLAITADFLLAQANSEPNNDLPNPYQSTDGWARMPSGLNLRTTGSSDSAQLLGV